MTRMPSMPSLSSWKTTFSFWACSVVMRSIVRECFVAREDELGVFFQRNFCVPEIQSVSTVSSLFSLPPFVVTILRWRTLPILGASSFLMA